MTKEKAIDVLRDIATEIDDFCHGAKHWRDKDKEELEALDMAIKALNVASTTEQSSKVGEWLHKRMPHDSYHITGQCSICKERSRINNYCPWCGAKMKG